MFVTLLSLLFILEIFAVFLTGVGGGECAGWGVEGGGGGGGESLVHKKCSYLHN